MHSHIESAWQDSRGFALARAAIALPEGLTQEVLMTEDVCSGQSPMTGLQNRAESTLDYRGTSTTEVAGVGTGRAFREATGSLCLVDSTLELPDLPDSTPRTLMLPTNHRLDPISY